MAELGLPEFDAAGLILAEDFGAVVEALAAMDDAEATRVLSAAVAMAHTAAAAGERMDMVARRVLRERQSGAVS